MGSVTDAASRPTPPEPLAQKHDLGTFASGVTALDEWLRLRARRNEAEGASRTFVTCIDCAVIGYYSLSAGSVLQRLATGRVRRNMPDPVPAILLGRLAVDTGWRGKGLGSDLVHDAVMRTLAAADIIGVRALLVHALSDEAKTFYQKHGFHESPVEANTLMITVAEAKRMLT